MPLWVIGFLMIVITQRMIELIIAKKNEKWIKARGGVETGEKHYKWFIIVHILFFISLCLEVMTKEYVSLTMNYFLLALYFIIQLVRVWCIATLGRYWNTKIIVIPKETLVRKGPYKYIKHPNYIIVGIELFIIPLLLHAYITMIIFPILHLLLLKIRIPHEELALAKLVDKN